MSVFTRYYDCLNCGNELTHLGKLSFNTPELVACDFCGQKYPGLTQKVTKRKRLISFLFLLIFLVLAMLLYPHLSLYTIIFALMPLLLIYAVVLNISIRLLMKNLQF